MPLPYIQGHRASYRVCRIFVSVWLLCIPGDWNFTGRCTIKPLDKFTYGYHSFKGHGNVEDFPYLCNYLARILPRQLKRHPISTMDALDQISKGTEIYSICRIFLVCKILKKDRPSLTTHAPHTHNFLKVTHGDICVKRTYFHNDTWNYGHQSKPGTWSCMMDYDW